MKARYEKKIFEFKNPSGTSRGILTQKISWFIYLKEDNDSKENQIEGIGECSIIPGLSPDFLDVDHYEAKIAQVCANINFYLNDLGTLTEFPSILFGLECAILDFKNGGKGIYFKNKFSRGEQQILINGLIWMGDKNYMSSQIEEKLKDGYTCLKMKVGAIDFMDEVELLKDLRDKFSNTQLNIRLDANGAFDPKTCISKLKILSQFGIHSIEQPIAPKQEEWMKKIIEKSPIPIALDEELIGVNSRFDKEELLDFLKPNYIIIKPSLHGGIKGSEEWIKYAQVRKISWWMTSALESNIGLNAIAQFAAEYPLSLPQGLGTGGLYTNNIESKLKVENGKLKLLK